MRVALLTAAFCALLAPTAAAGDPLVAEGLFRAGNEALAKGDLDRACEKFRESDRIDPAPGTLFHLAECEEKRGKLATAWTLYGEVKNRLAPNDDRHPLVKQRIDALDDRVPRLTLHMESPPSGTTIRVGETDVGLASLDVALPVDPGKVAVEVNSPGKKPWRQDVALKAGEKRELTLKVGEPVAAGGGDGPTPKPEPEPADSEGGANVPMLAAGIVIGVVGLGGIAAGIGLGAKAKADADAAGEHCNGNQCDQAGFDMRNDARTIGNIGTGVFFGGVALAAGGIALVLAGTLGGGDDSAAMRFRLTATGAEVRVTW